MDGQARCEISALIVWRVAHGQNQCLFHGRWQGLDQCLLPKRLLVIDLQEEEGEGDEPVRNPRVFVNPEILDPSNEHSLYNEGCLSVPDQYAEVERPAQIRARWQDLDGKVHEETMTGLMATCLQHEMDHLEGILFIDHLSRLKRQMVLKKIEKARKMGGSHVHNEHCRH